MRLLCCGSNSSVIDNSATVKVNDAVLLRGPDLKSQHGFQNQTLIDELNDTGCYIHVVAKTTDKINADFDKIEKHEYPTPATHAGIVPSRLYNIAHWQNCSGIVFSPSSVSLLSHKHDFWSNRLSSRCPKNISDFSKGKTIEDAYQEYANYLSDSFNTMNQPTVSAFIQNTPKIIRLKENMEFARSKYREMNARAGLAHQATGGIKDIPSKFVIADILAAISLPLRSLSKDDLIAAVNRQIKKQPELKLVLEHALLKIRYFDRARLIKYLEDAGSSSIRNRKHNFYSDFIKANETLAPNEHLLLPRLQEIKGIYTNVMAVAGIDHAFQIKGTLVQRQNKNSTAIPYSYALLYQPALQLQRPISQVGWSRVLLPWSTSGLIEFAKTGKVTAKDGANFPPNYFQLLSATASSDGKYRCPNDLSMVREGQNNLLHLAVKSGQSVSVIKFFYFWNVSPAEVGTDGKSAVLLASEKNHVAKEFLTTEIPHLNSAQKEQAKKNFIASAPASAKLGSRQSRWPV